MPMMDGVEDVGARVARYAALAPWIAITGGFAGAGTTWLLALACRRLLEALPARDAAAAALLAHGARAIYWSGLLQAALLLLLVPLAVYGRAYAGKRWPGWLGFVETTLVTVAAVRLFEGRVGDAAALVGFGGFLAGYLTRAAPPVREPSLGWASLGMFVLVGAPFARPLLDRDPAWLQGPVPPPVAVVTPLLACGSVWLAFQLGGPRLFHGARAGRPDPAHTWLLPAAVLLFGVVNAPDTTLRTAVATMTLTASAGIFAGARVWRSPRAVTWGVPLGIVASYASLYTSVLLPATALGPAGASAAGAAAGLLIALPVVLVHASHVGGTAALTEGAAWASWLAEPVSRARQAPHAAPSGRALRRLEREIAALLAHRAKHPALPFSMPRWPYGGAETGALAPLVRALGGEVPGSPDEASVGPLGWLARPDTLPDDLVEAPLAVRHRVAMLAVDDPSPARRLAWVCLQVRLDLHVGRIDAAVATVGRLFGSLDSGRLGAELGAGGLVDVLRGAEGPFTDVERPRLASSGALVEVLGVTAEELGRVHALALAARDPAALVVLEASRAQIEGWRRSLLPASADPVEAADRVAARARRLLERAWERRSLVDPGPVDGLLDDVLRMWWEEGLVPVLARAPGGPRVASVLAEAWWASVRGHVAASPTMDGFEDWWTGLSRRLDGVEELPCVLTGAEWLRAIRPSQGAPGRADAAGAEATEAPPPASAPPLRRPPGEPLPPAHVRAILGDDLRPAAGAVAAAVALSRDDPRALLIPASRAVAGLFPGFAALLDARAAGWIPDGWRASPRALLSLWEAAALALADVPGGEAEAARLDTQRAWLAERVGSADDRALAGRMARGNGLVARRLRAEELERALRTVEDPRDFLACVELLGRGRPYDGGLAALPDGDTVVVQALLDREILTLRRDASGTRLEREPRDTFALLARLDAWRGALRDGAPADDEAAWFGERFGERLVTPGVLHYVGIGPLARLPVSALRVDGGDLGRRQAWVRYERPSRVAPSRPVGALGGGVALWSRRHERDLPCAKFECVESDPLLPAHATVARTRAALGAPAPVHFACHARGGRLDDSDAELQCEDGTLSVASLGVDRVNAAVVYLSACEAAVGSLVAGEHPLGVAGALLARGAASVVATQWRLDDDVAPDVARRFWKGLHRGLAPPVALRAAVALDEHPASRWAVLEVHGGEVRPDRAEAST